MRRIAAIGLLSAMIGVAGVTVPAWADPSPNGPGQPGQSCQSFSATTRPGHRASSPGSPFNEPSINSNTGGTGGQHYSNNAQYDVACFQQSRH